MQNDLTISDDLYKKGLQFMQGSPTQQLFFEEALKFNPRNDKVFLEKAAWAIKTGRYKNFMSFISHAVEINRIHLGYRGWIKLYNLRDFRGAIQDLISYHHLFPYRNAWGENPNYLIGLAYMQLEDYDTAERHFDVAVERIFKTYNPSRQVDAYCFIQRAVCYMNLNKTKEAMADLEQSRTLFGPCAEAYYWLGTIQVETNRQEAYNSFSTALTLAREGRIRRNDYKELIAELYIEDIVSKIDSLNPVV
jgi:tetratricopeptide (TPR) repeat protein